MTATTSNGSDDPKTVQPPLLPSDLYVAWAPAASLMRRAFSDWKVRLRPKGSDPFAEAMWRDLKDEYLRLERVQTEILSVWAEKLIATTRERAIELVAQAWDEGPDREGDHRDRSSSPRKPKHSVVEVLGEP